MGVEKGHYVPCKSRSDTDEGKLRAAKIRGECDRKYLEVFGAPVSSAPESTQRAVTRGPRGMGRKRTRRLPVAPAKRSFVHDGQLLATTVGELFGGMTIDRTDAGLRNVDPSIVVAGHLDALTGDGARGLLRIALVIGGVGLLLGRMHRAVVVTALARTDGGTGRLNRNRPYDWRAPFREN